jgi:hypothetical protein
MEQQQPPSTYAAVATPYSSGAVSADGLWTWNGVGWIPSVSGFHSATGRARVALGMLGVWVVVAVVLIAALAGRIQLINDIVSGNTGNLSLSDLQASDNFVHIAAWSEIGAYLLAAIVFLVWLHRAVANNFALGEQALRFTPGWSVGWWFVPIVSFVRPFQVMSETWRASDPRHLRSNPETRRRVGIAVIVVWWPVFLLGDLITRFTIIGGSSETLDKLHTNAVVGIVALVVELFAAGLAMWLVLRISHRQDLKAHAVAQPLPPPLAAL